MSGNSGVQQKMSRASSFEDVLHGGGDKVFARQLLAQYVPLHVQEKIIEEFNAHVDVLNSHASHQ